MFTLPVACVSLCVGVVAHVCELFSHCNDYLIICMGEGPGGGEGGDKHMGPSNKAKMAAIKHDYCMEAKKRFYQ